MPSVRRLTAILAADVAGYSRLMGADEEGTHDAEITGWNHAFDRYVEHNPGTTDVLTACLPSTDGY